MLVLPSFCLNVINSCCLKPGFGFLTSIYPILSRTLQIFVLPVFCMPIFWPLQQDFRNTAHLLLPVTSVQQPWKAKVCVAKIKKHQKLKFRNWDNGCLIKISVAFHRPGLRNFDFHDAFWQEFVLMYNFPSRQEVSCVSWTQPGWPIAGKNALEIWLTRQAWTVCSEMKYFDFPVATFSVFKLSVLLLKREAFSESFSSIFDHLTSCLKQCNILSGLAKSGAFLTPFPQVRCWVILTHTETHTHTHLKKPENCYIIRSTCSRSGSEFSF